MTTSFLSHSQSSTLCSSSLAHAQPGSTGGTKAASIRTCLKGWLPSNEASAEFQITTCRLTRHWQSSIQTVDGFAKQLYHVECLVIFQKYNYVVSLFV